MSNSWDSLNSDDKEQAHEFVKHIRSKKMSKKEALAWQAGQLELVNQLIELLPTHNIEGLLRGWKKVLVDSEPV